MNFFRKFKGVFAIILAVVAIIGIAIGGQAVIFNEESDVDKIASKSVSTTSVASTKPAIKETTAKIGSTGDILIHSPILDVAKNGNSYDFTSIFDKVKPYYKKYDYMVANLEVSLGGETLGYSGYPLFNCPDSILDALKFAGVNMLTTANNHCYDTGKDGFYRTVNAVANSNLDYIGTRRTKTQKPYLVKNINNIKIGFINYTYETSSKSGKAINGISVDKEDAPLINSFNYDDLENFYAEISQNINNMYFDGAEAIVLYIHWGDEYKISANNWQKQIAQKLCDLGIDVIIGGHPHVIEPIELLNSTDGKKQTICLYSLGNEISNQRKNLIEECPTGHTEDGLIFGVEFAKKSDGRVILQNIDVLPTWVNLSLNTDGSRNYSIIPLDISVEDWSKFGIDSVSEAHQSYDRTMQLIKNGLSDFNNEYIKTDLRKK